MRVAAEACPPQRVGEHDDAVRTRLVLLGATRAPQRRQHTEHGEEVPRHEGAGEPVGGRRVGEGEVRELLGGELLKRRLSRVPVDEVAVGNVSLASLPAFGDADHALRVREREWPQHDAPHRAEDGRRGANA